MEIYPWSWLFFVPFIVLTSFAVLNLFIAIIVNAMQSQHESEHQAAAQEAHADAKAILDELHALRRDVADLRDNK
jgi:voltage-gated sodium channel